MLGQIVVPLSNVDDSRSIEPLRVPLQPGLCCADLVTSPGELVYDVWITAQSEDRSLASRTTTGLGRLRRKLNISPTASSTSRWNELKTSRKHSVDTLIDLHAGSSPDYCHISFDDDSSPITADQGFMPTPSPDGYVKRSSLPSVSEYYFPRPQILEVCPSEGPTTGGTVVTVRGRDLGLSRDDVIGLFICGSDVVDSVRYISSERLVCTTVPWRPCVGSVTVETASGGRICSAAQFTFVVGSEPPTSRVSQSSAQPSSELSTTRSRRRRFSLDALENIESSSLCDNEPKRTPGKDVVLRRQKSHDVTTSAVTSSSELSTPVVEVQSVRTSRDVTRPQTRLPQIKDHAGWKFNNEKVHRFYYFC